MVPDIRKHLPVPCLLSVPRVKEGSFLQTRSTRYDTVSWLSVVLCGAGPLQTKFPSQ